MSIELRVWDKIPRNALACLVVAAIGCPLALGQAASETLGSKDVPVLTLLKRIEELEASQKLMQQKIDQLTGGTARQPVQAEPAASPSATAERPAEAVADDDHVTTIGPLKLQAFSNFDFGRPWFEKLPEGGLTGSKNSFTLGDFDLFTNTRISDHWSVLGELLITSDFTNEFGAEMDRLLLTYNANDYLKVSFGKYNTAMGYYTNAFHRAHYFQTAVSRPLMYADEDNGGILPVHNIGITATGKIPSGVWNLHWTLDLANGRGVSTDVPIQNFVDENNGKAVNVGLFTRPDWLPGFQAGVSLYRDTLHPLYAPSMRETIPAAYVVYVSSKLEWLNEIAVVRHAVLDSDRVYHAVTSYSQISRAFGGTRPYFRFDYQNVASSDPILGSLGRASGPSFGVEQRISRFLIVKGQYGRLTLDNHATNAFNGQFAFAF